MITNQRGSTLLTVLIINLVLIILGMSIISATIGSAKRTAMRDSEISITYGAMDAVNSFTNKLVQKLDDFEIYKYFSNSNSYKSDLEKEVLEGTMDSFLKENSSKLNNDILACINLIDVTGVTPNYVFPETTDGSKVGDCVGNLSKHKTYKNAGLNVQDNLTRVYDLVIQTKNPIETQGNVEKLVTKRMILSPLPSFLRYAVGSNSLSLNGSSNIVGNIFAEEKLFLENKANYSTSTSPNLLTSKNQYPSIVGNIYSTNPDFLDKLKPDNFYNKTVPNISHDSQFANINFDKTFIYSIVKSLNSMGILKDNNMQDITLENIAGYTQDLRDTIKIEFLNLSQNITGFVNLQEEKNGEMKDVPGIYLTPQNSTIKGPIIFKETTEDNVIDITIDHETTISDGLYVDGNLILHVNQKLTVNGPIYVNGNVTIYSNAPLTIGENIKITDTLTIGENIDKNTFYTNGNLNIIASNPINIFSKVITTDSISLTNLASTLNINNAMLSGENISILSSSPDSGNTNITKITNDLISVKDTAISSENMKTEISSNLFTLGNFTISGNEEDEKKQEDDNVLFNSVIYVNGATTISNTNISTINSADDNLVLMSKGSLLLTRINEFSYYTDSTEDDSEYLPLNDKNITPIKGFFYTDSDAELYGVGSLFYIHGGIFAKNNLVINAVRGETSKSGDLLITTTGENKLSRFIVKYDDSILFNSLTSLPIVRNLQLIMDEQTVQ